MAENSVRFEMPPVYRKQNGYHISLIHPVGINGRHNNLIESPMPGFRGETNDGGNFEFPL